MFGAGSKGTTHTKAALADRQLRGRAADARARGGNPVRVADVSQRHSTQVNGVIRTAVLKNGG